MSQNETSSQELSRQHIGLFGNTKRFLHCSYYTHYTGKQNPTMLFIQHTCSPDEPRPYENEMSYVATKRNAHESINKMTDEINEREVKKYWIEQGLIPAKDLVMLSVKKIGEGTAVNYDVEVAE